MTKLTVSILRALYRAKYMKRIKSTVEPMVADNARRASYYAEYILNGPFPEGEAAIAKNLDFAYGYASEVLKGPFPAGEAAIARNPKYALNYAEYILKGPFPAGEAAIATDSRLAYYYASEILKGPFPAGEKAIARNVTFAELYAEDCLHLEGHKAGDWSWDYLETHKTSAVQDLSRMYLSFELDPASKALILDTIGGKFRRKVCNHITVAYNITEELYQELMSSLKDATLEVIGYQSGDGVDCVAVEVNGSLDRKDGEIYHVTVSLAPGHKAEESKALLKQQGIQHVIPFDIHGELKLMKK